MKWLLLIVLLILSLLALPLSTGMAQEAADQLESLQVSFWPDFDDPSVLVLITGQLPEATVLPAEVAIPIPENAEINAVARVDEDGMASVDFEVANGTVNFTTMNPRFRVEYYAPYLQDGGSRSYDFDWQSDFSVAEFVAEIQQPANATTLSSEPGATNVSTNQNDGLVYHNFNPLGIPAGTPYQLSFNYDMASDALTVGPSVSVPETAGQSAPDVEGDNNWLLFAGVAALVALAVVVTWLVVSRSSGKKSGRPQKPKPKARSTKKKAALYCHNCGQPATGDDRFCRQCGTELK